MNTETSLVLRVCAPDFTSYNGFQWPDYVGAEVSAPDWNADAKCGGGLHGWLHGHGDIVAVAYCQYKEAKWMVLEVTSADIVMLEGKCKFPRATIRFIGSVWGAAEFIKANDPKSLNKAVIGECSAGGYGAVVNAGCLGAAVAGEKGMATAGDCGEATAGVYGTATVGYDGTATAGDYGTATAGNYGTATAGYKGTATAGYKGTATAGGYGTATAGPYGTAKAGPYGTATAGRGGVAAAGERGMVMAGKCGEISIRWWDDKAARYRTRVGYVGEDGIKADTPYRLNDNREFVEAN